MSKRRVNCSYCGQLIKEENTKRFGDKLFCFKKDRNGEVYLNCLPYYWRKPSLPPSPKGDGIREV